MEYALLSLCLLLLLYVASADLSSLGWKTSKEIDMGSPADLAKLVSNMKRANGIVDRASADATKHALIMDSFEQRLNLNHESMSKIEEYDKMMAAMDQGNNGGPALETTFPTGTPGGPTSSTHISSSGVGMFNH